MARGMKEGSLPKTYSKEAAKVSDSMSLQQLKDYCPDKKK